MYIIKTEEKMRKPFSWEHEIRNSHTGDEKKNNKNRRCDMIMEMFVVKKGSVKEPMFLEQVNAKESVDIQGSYYFTFNTQEKIALFRGPAPALPSRQSANLPRILCFESERERFTSAVLFIEKEDYLNLSVLCTGTFVLFPTSETPIGRTYWKTVSDAKFQYYFFDKYSIGIAYSNISLVDLRLTLAGATHRPNGETVRHEETTSIVITRPQRSVL